MMRPLLLVAGLLGLALPTSAQLQISARFGKHVTVGADFGGIRCLPPVPVRHHHAGDWRTVSERVWVPGQCRTIHHPAVWGWGRDHCGRRVWTVVCPARTEIVQEPGHWEWQTKRVWVPCGY